MCHSLLINALYRQGNRIRRGFQDISVEHLKQIAVGVVEVVGVVTIYEHRRDAFLDPRE